MPFIERNWKGELVGASAAPVIAVALAFCSIQPAEAASACREAPGALCAIDGDTIIVGNQRIRIANIDAPEIHEAKCDAERRLGQVARDHMAGLLASGRVEVKPGDPASGRVHDRFGRVLAIVTVNGRDVGATMISASLARPWQGKRKPWCVS